MSLNLLNSFGKRGVVLGLLSKQADVTDSVYLSKYFVISEFNSKFTAGRNAFSLNGSAFLKTGSEILVECIDSAGQNLYIEMAKIASDPAKTYAYKEATSFVLSIHVYNDTADGIAKLIVFGTLIDGRTVKWQQNVTVDKTLQNSSKVRFYTRPVLEVDSILVPVLSSDIASTLKQTVNFNGSGHGLAVNPPKDTNLPTVNRRNIDINYQLVCDNPSIVGNVSDINAFNSQMVGSTVNLLINKIQIPYSTTDIVPTNRTSSTIISEVVNNKTLKLIDPYFYPDSKNNIIITNISDVNFAISYPYVAYNNITSSYQTTTINGTTFIIQQCYADVVYRNIRTFTGFLARHKLYRKSLLSTADFSVIADEPLFVNELLRDNLTQNKFYELLGKFYTDEHISHYWFTSSNNLKLAHTPQTYMDSCFITSSVYNSLKGDDYIMVKNDSVGSNRNAIYVPFSQIQFDATSGSAYDSNFIELKKGVQYVLQIDTTIKKDPKVLDASLEFYFTSSVLAARNDPNYTDRHGIRLASLFADQLGSIANFDKQYFFFTPQDDLYGTLVIVPYRSQAYLKNISFRVYGDGGFSPDLFITRVPWPISVANETYQIKSELFDINHNLVYSDLNVLQNFDPSGSSLIPYIPGSNGSLEALDVFVSGSLIVSKSIESMTGNILVDRGSVVITLGNLYLPSMLQRPADEISSSRLIAKLGHGSDNGKLAYTNITDLRHDGNYIYLSTGSYTIDTGTETNNYMSTRTSLTSIYGRKIYWIGESKQNESL